MAVIEIQDDAGIKTVGGYHDRITGALAGDDEIVIDLSGVKRLDLAMVQLIIEAGREARKRSKVLKMRSVSADVRKQFEICGIGR